MESILKYPHLFEPIVLAGTVFRNRVFSSPQGFYNLGPECYPNDACAAFFARKAEGGVASVCIGDCIVDGKTGTHYPFLMRIDESDSLPGFAEYASQVSRRGCVASVELSHAGIYAQAVAARGDPVYGPVEMEGQYGHVLEMPESEIERIIGCYAKAAAFAKGAGCGMVTVHGGHGWMLAQFWNKNINTRKDKWGGPDIENRMRFSLEVCRAIRRAVGNNFPIEFRMSGSECCPGGYDIDEGIEFAKRLDGLVDLIHVSAGHHQQPDAMVITHPSMFCEDGCNAKYAREIKKHVRTPVAAVGGFTDPEMMEELIASGGADVVEFARQTLADPDFVNKARTGREDEINKCLRCMSCFASTGEGRHFHCAINPETGHELEYRSMPPVKEKKTVLVAGGGVGGMEAALTAARRGHRVILCEKGPKLGGVLLCEDKVPFKKHLKEYLERQAMLCAREGVEIRLNTEVTPRYALAEKPDVLIAALGARPVMPPVEGIDGANVFAAEEVYADPAKAGKKTVVLGAGLVGLEIALFLTDLGVDVTVTEIAAFPNMGFGSMHTLAVNKELRERNIPVRLSTKTTRIRSDGAEIEDANGAGFIPADTVIVAAGMRALRDEAAALAQCAPEFVMLGDCRTPKNIIAATQPAHTAAMLIGAR
ncbi:MAG: FAD-dependent oxidoreductase [Oscillospiraceae bacterium]|nr:FAD-dependent oxidoreductase [Oscillospiraceae bacterium]